MAAARNMRGVDELGCRGRQSTISILREMRCGVWGRDSMKTGTIPRWQVCQMWENR